MHYSEQMYFDFASSLYLFLNFSLLESLAPVQTQIPLLKLVLALSSWLKFPLVPLRCKKGTRLGSLISWYTNKLFTSISMSKVIWKCMWIYRGRNEGSIMRGTQPRVHQPRDHEILTFASLEPNTVLQCSECLYWARSALHATLYSPTQSLLYTRVLFPFLKVKTIWKLQAGPMQQLWEELKDRQKWQ